MNWGQIGQWMLTLGMAAVISAAVAWPKSRGEGKKASAEAEATPTTVAVQSLKEALSESKDATRECKTELERSERRTAARDMAIDSLIDAMFELLRLVPADAEQTLRAREAISAARRARHNIGED